jgi:hypothetical protein
MHYTFDFEKPCSQYFWSVLTVAVDIIINIFIILLSICKTINTFLGHVET